jgi:diguanylate cyclase (GGDEF)-like protein/PAS domain S-box-containing protein
MSAVDSASLLRLATRLTGLPVALLVRLEGCNLQIVGEPHAGQQARVDLGPLLRRLLDGRQRGLIRAVGAAHGSARPEDQVAARLAACGFGSAVVAPLPDPGGAASRMLCCLGPPGVTPEPTAADALADLAGLAAAMENARRATERAEAGEARLRAAIDSIPHHFWVTDAEGRYVLQNAEDRATYGDLIGLRADQSGMPAEIIDEWRDRHRRVLAGETLRFAGAKCIGEREIVAERLIAPLVIDDVIVGQVGLAVDITARVQTERRLAESEARLRAAVDALPFPFFICDLDGRHILQNARDREVWGDGIGKTFAELGLPAAIVASLPEAIERIRAGEARHKLVCYRHGGELRHVEEVYAPVEANGTITGFVGLAIDHTDRVLTEQRLQESEARLRDYLATASDWLWETDAAHRFIRGMGELRRSGLRLDDLIGESLQELVEDDPARECYGEEHRADLAHGRQFRDRLVRRADGTGREVWLEVSGNPLLDSAGRLIGYRGTARDVTDRVAAEVALREAHARLEALAASGLIGITAGRGWLVEEGNDAFLRMLGRHRAELEAGALDWRELADDQGGRPVEERRGGAVTGTMIAVEQELVRSDGSRVPVLLNRVVLHAAEERWFALVQDLTTVKAAEQRIRMLAERDGLTGLANRRVLFERLQGDLADRRRPGDLGALLMLDLDHFKDVNDRLGHNAGDALLRAVGERLTRVLRDTDTIARLGGDEFAMVLRDLQGPAAAADIATKLLAVLGEPLEFEGQLLQPRCSIGISLFPRDGADVMRLLKNADIALYQAKAKGRGRFCFFEPALLEAIERRQAIGEALQAGIAEKAFEIELQPQIHLASGCHAGFEALVRWRRDGELVAPDEFIGIAEEVGVIASLGRLVLRHALEALRRCDDLGLDAGHVAVNLAAAQLRAPGFPAEVAALLGELGLEAGRLELEVTEGVLLDRDAVAISTSLRELHGLGVTITLDDFGTGAASLAHLKSFPVDRLKIDRSFVRGIGRNADDAVFVCTIINLAHTLGMVVVAEGVETAEQEAFLELHGCDLAQGFRFARPMPADGIAAYLAPTGVLAR